jgi:integrase/recombinase XerD
VRESARRDGFPVKDDFPNKALVWALEQIGITREEQRARNITPHSLRHSYITLARLSGIDDLTVRTLAGHRDIGMTDRYTHVAQDMDYEAIRAKFRLIA